MTTASPPVPANHSNASICRGCTGSDARAHPDPWPTRPALSRIRHHPQQDRIRISARFASVPFNTSRSSVKSLPAQPYCLRTLGASRTCHGTHRSGKIERDRKPIPMIGAHRRSGLHDGIVNKQMGDGLMAIFNFPIVRKDHATAAIIAAVEGIQRSCTAALNSLNPDSGGLPGRALGVGIGIHTGDVQIGEFSRFRSDFTAIGGVVNLARGSIRRRRRDSRVSRDGRSGSRTSRQEPKCVRLCSSGIEQQVQAVLVKSCPAAPPRPSFLPRSIPPGSPVRSVERKRQWVISTARDSVLAGVVMKRLLCGEQTAGSSAS